MIDPQRLRALAMAKGLPLTPAQIARVAREVDEDSARWAFIQWDLRSRARAKFSRAGEMLFVREALEQATHENLAEYHASRFPEGALVADLTAGIGADLVALSRRGPVVGYELDPERAEYANWNAGQDGLVKVEDSLTAAWDFDYAFADPARRVEGRRTLDPEDFSPNPVLLAERMKGLKLGGMKLSPLLPDPFLESLGPGLEFVSLAGECREALVWTGSESIPGRWAVRAETGERLEAEEATSHADEPGEFLYEADPAAIRAHCLGTLCRVYGLVALGDSNGYLSGPTTVHSPWLKGYRVLYHGRADSKATRQALRSLGADTPVLKQRGAKLDLPLLAKEFSSQGSLPVALAIWPVGKSLRHTVLTPLSP
jgi:hypothetical protein